MKHSSAKEFVKVDNLGKRRDGTELTHVKVSAYYHKPEYIDGKPQGFYLSISPVALCRGLVSWSSEEHPFNRLIIIKRAMRDNKRYTESLVREFVEAFREDPTVECMNRMIERFWAAA